MSAATPGSKGGPRRPLVPIAVRRVATALVLALVVEYLVVPQVAGARKAVHLVSQANLALALLGVALEVGSLLAYSALVEALLPKGSVRFNRVLRINLATLALSHVLPGGTAAGGTLGFRLLTGEGVAGTDAATALATQGIGSAGVLNILLWLALVVSIPLAGFNALYVTAAVLGALVIAFIAALIVLFTRGEERAVTVVRAVGRRLPLISPDTLERIFRAAAVRVRELTSDRRLLTVAVGWAAANWLLDAASLWVFVEAFGHRTVPYGLLVAYGLANVLAAIPITPGGLGVVEGVLTPTLVGFGTPRGVAILGVLSWRLVNFWLPIPVGAGTYVSLRAGGLFHAEEVSSTPAGPGGDCTTA
ncbi:MAG TPA: YbhN family protein [Acidimicrobiales bacterium]|nr:YbhN family protein [Acidimicrobiales bacterium]